MAIREALLPEFDQEMAITRKTLERVPDDKFSWKPHEKSSTLGLLAGHVATLPSLAKTVIIQDELGTASGGQAPAPPAWVAPKNRQGLLESFDKLVAEARAAISETSDADFMRPWTLRMNGQVLMCMPKATVVRSFVINHLIHHRAQLGVYLRLNDIPVPSTYGPSADENPLQDLFVGTWILNVEKSEYDANHRPRAGTVVMELDAEGYYLKKAEGINGKGEKVVERPVRFIPDGRERPIPDFPGLKYVATRPEPNTITGEARREDGSVVGGNTTVVSADGKSLTVSNFGYDTQLRQFKLRTVWDRQ